MQFIQVIELQFSTNNNFRPIGDDSIIPLIILSSDGFSFKMSYVEIARNLC
jgi:hypothetical protein